MIIYSTYVLPWLYKFYKKQRKKLASKIHKKNKTITTQAKIKRLDNIKNKRAKPEKHLEKVEEMLYFSWLFYILKIIGTKQISSHFDNLLTGYLRIIKAQEPVI